MGLYQTGHELSPKEIDAIISFLHALTEPVPDKYVQPPVPSAVQDSTLENTDAADRQGE